MRIVPDGLYYAGGLIIAGIAIALLLSPWVSIPFCVLALFCLYFFRDPNRTPPPGDVLVSPADGRVVSVKRISETQTRISVFLNIFNVHVNRAPIAGQVVEVVYRRGKFINAAHESASLDNEQNTLVIEGNGSRVICRQIAGLIARRIVCYKRAGEMVAPAERIGLIKFGSRVDVFFGPEWEPLVAVGTKVAAGTSVLARRTNRGELV